MHSLLMRSPSARLLMGCAVILIAALLLEGTALASQPKQKTFTTPAAAVEALVKALRGSSEKELLAILGPNSRKLILSGDPVEDKKEREKFILRYDEKNHMKTSGKTKAILYVGSNDWPFPVPIVKTGQGWHFDTKKGREEILRRRIGRNELGAIQTCLAIADAEHEYATLDRNGDGRLEYAQKLLSTRGKTDGLYWEVKSGEKPSPLGPLAAKAQAEGYMKDDKPAPYNGYFFRILTAQGGDARGGTYSYLVNGNMIGGFALVAFPASYGDSGVMTFIVNFEGVVYQKDLGPKTVDIAKNMQAFNPDRTWKKAE